MPPNPLSGLAAVVLTTIGYVREWGEAGGLQLFIRYGEAGCHPVVLQDSEHLTAEDIVKSLNEQGVDMVAFFAAFDDLDAE